jgi:hypothetical protein
MMVLFYFKFVLTGILFSLVIGALLVRFDKNRGYSSLELVLYSLGLGPAITVLILYYLMLLVPGKPHFFYLAAVFLIFGVMFIFALKGFAALGRRLYHWAKSCIAAWKGFDTRQKIKITAYWGVLSILLAGFLVIYPTRTLQTPMEHHDALVYGNLAKLHYQKREVTYSPVMLPAENGFVFQGTQKPSFSLLLTWEMMLNPKTANQQRDFDMFFKSTSGYYGLLIAAVFFLWLYRKNKYLALLGLLALLSGLRFFFMLLNYHLDAYRIFFLLVSWVWLAYAVKKKDRFSMVLLGVFSGLAAFSHLIGFVAAALSGMALLLFDDCRFKSRLAKVAALALFVIACGGVHYLLEAIMGAKYGFLTYVSF